MKQNITFQTEEKEMDGNVQPGGFLIEIVNAETNQTVVGVEITADAKITVEGTAFNGATLTQELAIPGQYYPRVARVDVMGKVLAFAIGPTVGVLAPVRVAVPIEVVMQIL